MGFLLYDAFQTDFFLHLELFEHLWKLTKTIHPYELLSTFN